jgi:BirA family transcriptional regulator, biotin operon repressor / biotin---[acetyl-CoA-carboxylase] ligase
MKGDDSNDHNIKFALLKNSNLLPDPGMEKPHSTTFDNQLIELDSVDSTNNYAMARIHAGMASDGLVCLARHQWAGKGQRGKSWKDEPGQNLMMSLVSEPAPLDISKLFLFSASVALGILDLVRRLDGESWAVKWPNDIYWNDRKAAGILIETVVLGKNWLFAVTGVGINLNQENFPADLPHAVSLKQITSASYEPIQVARELVPAIQNRINTLKNHPEQILSDYNRFLYKKNQPISLRKKNELIICTLKSVDIGGMLLTSQGSFAWHEVNWVIH